MTLDSLNNLFLDVVFPARLHGCVAIFLLFHSFSQNIIHHDVITQLVKVYVVYHGWYKENCGTRFKAMFKNIIRFICFIYNYVSTNIALNPESVP